eukprot:PhM_4_TR1913/c0_g2_i1/m.31742
MLLQLSPPKSLAQLLWGYDIALENADFVCLSKIVDHVRHYSVKRTTLFIALLCPITITLELILNLVGGARDNDNNNNSVINSSNSTDTNNNRDSSNKNDEEWIGRLFGIVVLLFFSSLSFVGYHLRKMSIEAATNFSLLGLEISILFVQGGYKGFPTDAALYILILQAIVCRTRYLPPHIALLFVALSIIFINNGSDALYSQDDDADNKTKWYILIMYELGLFVLVLFCFVTLTRYYKLHYMWIAHRKAELEETVVRWVTCLNDDDVAGAVSIRDAQLELGTAGVLSPELEAHLAAMTNRLSVAAGGTINSNLQSSGGALTAVVPLLGTASSSTDSQLPTSNFEGTMVMLDFGKAVKRLKSDGEDKHVTDTTVSDLLQRLSETAEAFSGGVLTRVGPALAQVWWGCSDREASAVEFLSHVAADGIGAAHTGRGFFTDDDVDWESTVRLMLGVAVRCSTSVVSDRTWAAVFEKFDGRCIDAVRPRHGEEALLLYEIVAPRPPTAVMTTAPNSSAATISRATTLCLTGEYAQAIELLDSLENVDVDAWCAKSVVRLRQKALRCLSGRQRVFEEAVRGD